MSRLVLASALCGPEILSSLPKPTMRLKELTLEPSFWSGPAPVKPKAVPTRDALHNFDPEEHQLVE